MAAEEDVSVRFGATITDFKAKLSEVVNLIGGVREGAQKELAERAVASFGQFGTHAISVFDAVGKKAGELPESFRAVGVAMAGALAVIGAGVAAKKFADNNAEMVESTRDFARAMGSTTNEASVMQAALDDVGASQQDYIGAAKGLQRQLRTNEDDLRRMGLATRDAAGNFRPLNDLMADAIRITNDYKAGTDRNIASQTLFGRGIDAGSRLLMVNAETIAANKAAVEELNLEVGEAAVQAWADYDNASDRAALTVKAFGKAIGESVLPFVTELTEWFNNIAPMAIQVTRGALGGLTTAFLSLTNGVRVVWETINAMVISVAEPLVAMGRAIGAVLAGEGLEAAAEHLRNIPKTVTNSWETAFSKIADSSQKTNDRISSVWAWATGGNRAAGDGGAAPGGKAAPGVGVNGMNAGADLALAKARAEAALKLELQYLKEARGIYEQSYKDGLISTKVYYDAKLAVEIQGIEAVLNARRAELEAARKAEAEAQKAGADAKPQDRAKYEAQAVKFQAEQVKLAGDIAVLERQRVDVVRQIGDAYEDATRKVQDDLAAIRNAGAKDAAQSEVQAQRSALDQMVALRQISAEQAFQVQRQIEARAFSAAADDIARRRALIRGTQDEQLRQQEELNAEKERLEREYQQRVTEIDHAAVLERQRYSIEAQQSVQSGFATLLTDLMSGQRRVGDVMRSFAMTIVRTFENLIAQRFAERLFGAGSIGGSLIDSLTKPILDAITAIAVKWGITEVAQTTATQAQSAARIASKTAEVSALTSIEVAGSAAALAAQKAATISGVLGWASTAAAAAMASVAAIPVIGWALAPEVGAATYATALGFLATAKGGWESVPYDGAMAKLHEKEMVLPAWLATGVRQMAEPGQMQSTISEALQQMQPMQGGGDSVHVTIQAVDAVSVKRLFEQHGGAMVAALRKQRRDFAF